MPDTDVDNEFTVDATGTDDNPVEEKERQQVEALTKSYNAARRFDRGARREYVRDRKYAAGKANPEWAVDANMIGTFIDILVSFLYAKNPDIVVRPAEVVGDTPDQDMSDFADTMRLVVSRLWKQGRLKKAARKLVRSSLSVGPGWIKVIMTSDKKTDPIVERELSDLQDNLLRLRAKREELKNEDGELDDEEINVKIAEKEQLEKSLEKKVEIVIRRSLAIDFVRADDMQVSLDVAELSDYLDANWIGNQMFIERSELPVMFPRLDREDVKEAQEFFQREVKSNADDDATAEAAQFTKVTTNTPRGTETVAFVRVLEIWDRRDNHIKTVVDGVGKWAREPYQPKFATSRFYPYFYLALFEVDSERHPQSLSGRLKKLQDEYASARSNGRLARSRSIPGVIFDAGKISPDDAAKVENAVEQEFVGINPIAGDDLSKAFAAKPVGRYDPRIYDTSPTLRDMERIGGVQEALQQSVSAEKTATEANIQREGFQSRTGADRDTLEDLLADLAQYSAELAIQGLTAKFAQRLAGPKAFWPEGMDMEDIVTMVELEIDGGSTAKPNQDAERHAWSVIMPLLRETMVVIQQAFAQGNEPLANALMELIEETVKRMDDRINLKRFLPTLAETMPGAIPAEGAGGPSPVGGADQPAPGGATPAPTGEALA